MSNLEKVSNVVLAGETNNTLSKKDTGAVQVLTMISGLVQKDTFDIHALEKLIELQNNSEDRQAKRSFNLNLSEMLSEIPVIAKTGLNTYNGTRFAKLEDIVETTRPILHKYGFSVTYKQSQEMIPNAKTEPNSIFCMMTVTCVLKHRDGHEESNSIQLPVATIKGQTPIQAMGMGSTYGRRYTLMQALNIAVAEDDQDGFAVNAKIEASKKEITDARLEKAIEQVNLKNADLQKDLLDKFDLTPAQLIKIGKECKQ